MLTVYLNHNYTVAWISLVEVTLSSDLIGWRLSVKNDIAWVSLVALTLLSHMIGWRFVDWKGAFILLVDKFILLLESHWLKWHSPHIWLAKVSFIKKQLSSYWLNFLSCCLNSSHWLSWHSPHTWLAGVSLYWKIGLILDNNYTGA